MLLYENLKLALFSIRSNKMRAFLTMLGIIIGITSVISISALGEASKAIINKEFDNFNKNLAIVYMSYNPTVTVTENDFITLDDLDLIRDRFGDKIENVSPSVSGTSGAVLNNKEENVSLSGVSASERDVTKIDIIAGRFISESDVLAKKPVIVAEKKLVEKLGIASDPIGQSIRVTIEGTPQYVTIIGVYKVEENLFSGLSGQNTLSAYVPYSLFNQALDTMSYMQFKVRDEYSQNMEQIAKDVVKFLERSKGTTENMYSVQTVEGQQKTINSMLGTLSLAIGAIGAISLVVGGIGIMNIMLVSVTERTREIGIRKSLGARKRDILMQFLIESMIVSALGGIIGILLGLAASTGVAAYLKISNPVSVTTVIGTVIFSAFVGIFFGIYPANKAAKLDPIDALRYE